MTIMDTSIPAPRNWTYWLGWVLSGLAIAFLLMDGVMKLLMLDIVISSTTELGYPVGSIRLVGTIVLVSTLLYVFPRTSVLGAVLLTGLLGGAVATHVRIDSPLFSHVLFGVYLGLFVWGGLWLRDERLRALLPFRG
jgi:hypothetical protein